MFKKILVFTIFLVAALLAIAGISELSHGAVDDGEPLARAGKSSGKYGETYQVWVGTTPFRVLSIPTAEITMDWLIENIGTGNAWFDFDVTVSTYATNSYSVDGYVTGENGKLVSAASISSNALIADELYFVSDLAAGTTLQVILFKRWP